MKIKEFVFFLVALLLKSSLTAPAAGRFDHEILGSFNMLRSSIAPVEAENNRWGMGFGGGAGYACHFSPNLSFRTGLNVSYYRSTTGMAGINDSLLTTIPDELGWWSELIPKPVDNANDFILYSSMNEYVAQQSALYVQIPLLVEYQSMFQSVKHLGWYVAGGAKLGYAITGHSDADIKDLTTTAKLVYQGIMIDEPKELGFGVEVNENVISKLDLGFQAIGYLEVGFKQQLTDKYTLYAGVFGEYCLYSMVGSAAPSMLEYEMLPVSVEQLLEGAKAYRFRYNPSANVTGSSVKTSYPLSFGITVRLGFSFSKRARQRNDQLFNVRYFQF
jgi:hypothetical protein